MPLKTKRMRRIRILVSSLPVWFAVLVMSKISKTHPGESVADAQRHTLLAWGAILLVAIITGIVMLFLSARSGEKSA